MLPSISFGNHLNKSMLIMNDKFVLIIDGNQIHLNEFVVFKSRFESHFNYVMRIDLKEEVGAVGVVRAGVWLEEEVLSWRRRRWCG